jgi:hypothetical protein
VIREEFVSSSVTNYADPARRLRRQANCSRNGQ